LPPSAVDFIVRQKTGHVLTIVFLLLLILAALDGLLPSNPQLRSLYLLPLAAASAVLGRRQILVLATTLAVLGEQLSRGPWQDEWAATVATYAFVFCVAGLLLRELFAARRAALRYSAELVHETGRRQESELRMTSLVESMPAAILVVDNKGLVRLANRAAESLLGVGHGRLTDQSIQPYLPNLAEIAGRDSGADTHRTAANLQARRLNGEQFLASAWFSTYAARGGIHLVAILADASGDVRDFQESSFQSLLKSTRVLVGSVSHEIRNICAAIAIAQANLGRIPGAAGNEDYQALRSLVQSLVRLSAAELPDPEESGMAGVDLRALLDEFRIVMAPALREDSIVLSIDAFDMLPLAAADRHGLLQVLINLSRNSARAMRRSKQKSIVISVRLERGRLCIRLSDTGPGVKDPEMLFRAFQPGAESSGLGLFISRALVRSCGGDLSYEPCGHGCSMLIRLQPFTGSPAHASIHSLEIPA
jgi:PAS domain S-box-containing protein